MFSLQPVCLPPPLLSSFAPLSPGTLSLCYMYICFHSPSFFLSAPFFSFSFSPTHHYISRAHLSPCALLFFSCLFHLQLIIAIAGVLSGYNGSFEFKEPGQKYDDTPYVGMRVVGTVSPTRCPRAHKNG